MKRAIVIGVVVAAVTATVLWPQSVLSHETLTTTVLYDREIVRILDKHCVMCHVENGPAFALSTYEQTWLQGRQIRAGVIARHMPPWPAVQGYGQFANDNSLTLRETQFIVGWVEGLGPRNAGTVFTNIADAGAAARSMPMPMPMPGHTGHWHLGEPDLMLALPSSTIDAGQADQVKRTIVDPQLKTQRSIRGVEYMPGDRRVVRAAFFTIQETGQWIGSWTPWYGYTQVPAGSAYRLPAGAHIVAEIHYRGAKEQVVDRGMLGLLFADQAAMRSVSDLVLEPKSGKAAGDSKAAASGVAEKLGAETRIAADTYAWALRSEITSGVKSIEVSVRNPNGGTEILLFAKDFSTDWPTPYILTTPVLLRRGAVLSVTAYSANVGAPGQPGTVRLTVSRY